MKTSLLALTLAGVLSSASPISIEERQNSVGNGPFAPAGFYTTNAFGGHTFYAPKTVPSGTKLPVLLWGNGGCSADATGQAPFLTQLASHGILVIASGAPGGGGSTTADVMKQSIDFITKNAGQQGQFANVDASRITAAGWSCGGVEAYAQINDARVQSIGIWNSGLLGDYDSARSFRKPVFFFLGGPSDIAYQNGERDYSYMPTGTPKWKGNLNVGHGGTYTDYNGGKYGIIGGHWVQWILRGNSSASAYMTGSGARNDGWSVVSADLDKLSVTPIGEGSGGGGGGGSPTTTSSTPAPTGGNGGGGGSCSGLWGQCGGQGWAGPTCCSQGTCKASNQWYSQCLN